MKSDAEILMRIQELDKTDIFGWEANLLLTYLPYGSARPIIQRKNLRTSDSWNPPSREREAIIAMLEGQSRHALELAVRHRGGPVDRAVAFLRAWLWMLDDQKLLAFVRDPDNHLQFGVPILKAVREAYGFPFPYQDPRIMRMAQGLPCQPGGCPKNACMDPEISGSGLGRAH